MKYFFLLLLLSFLCFGDLTAQVGINNDNPSQALDVGGKIKVGDDEISPVAGTIRYNRVTKTFEGYDGTEWSVFNPEGDGGGSGDVPASGTVVSANVNTFSSTSFVSWSNNPDGGTFTSVPAGRTLYVTYINVTNSGSPYQFLLYATDQNDQPLVRTEFRVVDSNPVRNQIFSEPNGHLIVVPSGHNLVVRRDGAQATFFLRGFLQ